MNTAEQQTLVLSVLEMTCGHCERAITSSLGAVEGVECVEIDLGDKTVCVTGGAERAAIVAAIEDAGYEVC